ncbi:MAG: type Z 30S ribosomal protein S14 [Candidatus Wallbacteria bacterium]|nr:type Z 30S ribosomal protein S14 [Candidatus Wallbacteria bacterium]
MATKVKMEKQKMEPKFNSRRHNRCPLCGRPRAFMRDFNMCRLCFRKFASKGEIPGVMKSSW